MFSAGAGVFSPGAGVFFAGTGIEKPGVCTALRFWSLRDSNLNLTSRFQARQAD